MKRLLFIIAAVLLFSCEKEPYQEPIDPNKGNVTFWTTEDSNSSAYHVGWVLYVDDVKIGLIAKPYEIDHINKIPVCGDERFTNLSLMKGRHKYYMTFTANPSTYLVSRTFYFDVTAGGCTVVRCTQ